MDADIEKTREHHSGLNEALGGVQERYYAIGADIARTEQSVQLQQERARQLRADLEQTRRSREEAERHLRDDEGRLARLGAELEEVIPALAEAEATEASGHEALALADEAMHQWQLEWEEFSSASEKPRQEVEVQQSRIRHLEEALAQAQQRLERLEHEAAELDTTAVETERETLDERDRARGDQPRVAGARGHGARADRRGAREDHAVHRAARRGARRVAGAARARRLAAGAAAGRPARPDEVVTGWLQAQGLARNQRVAERLTVEPGWETAVETVLGSHLQAVCVDDMNPLAAALERFGAGTLGLFSPRAATGAGARRRALRPR